MKPTNFIAQLFWDSKADSYSMTRFMLLFTTVFTCVLVWDVRNIIIDAYYANRDIPQLEWYLAIIFGKGVTDVAPYAINRFSTKGETLPKGDEVLEDSLNINNEHDKD